MAQPGLAHLHGAQEVTGSNPVAPTNNTNNIDYLPSKIDGGFQLLTETFTSLLKLRDDT